MWNIVVLLQILENMTQINTKKSQITLFLIVLVAIFFGTIFVLYIFQSHAEKSFEDEQVKLTTQSLSDNSVQLFLSSCVEKSVTQAILTTGVANLTKLKPDIINEFYACSSQIFQENQLYFSQKDEINFTLTKKKPIFILRLIIYIFPIHYLVNFISNE